MKRFFSILIIAATLMSFSPFAVFAFAESFSDDATAGLPPTDVKDILKFSCRYKPETNHISITGTMEHDAVAQHTNSTLEIYAIPAGMSEYEVASAPDSVPVAKTTVSMKFDFTFSVASLERRYARYAVFLRSKEGTLTLGTEAQFAEVAYQPSSEAQKDNYKGISTANAAVASDIGADTAIIPVYLNLLFTESSSGYLYRTENNQYFFDKAYIDSLDGNINSASAAGTKIYIRFLLGVGDQFGVSEAPNAEYIMPNIYDYQTLVKIHSLTDFLVSRYEAVGLSGLVLGKGWDSRDHFNYSNADTHKHYVEKASFYASTVASCARSVDPTLDIVVPFMSDGLFMPDTEPAGSVPKLKAVLEDMLAYFTDTTENGLDFSLLVEGDDVPFGITNENISDGIDMKKNCENGCFCSRCQQIFADYLSEIEEKYSKAPKTYMYVWSIPHDLSGNALSAVYSYSYFALLSQDKLTSFVVSFYDTKRNEQKISELKYMLKYIDTLEETAVTKTVLSYFGKTTWREIVGMVSTKSKLIYNLEPSFSLPANCIGHFSYFRFSSHILDPNWLKGVGCKEMRIDYADAEARALRAELSGDSRGEIVYKYDKYENFKYAPYLEFDLMLSDGSKGKKYELTLSFGSKNVQFESSSVIFSGERCSIILDLSRFTNYSTAEGMKISVRPLESDTLDKAVLLLYDLEGHSISYTSEQLEDLIGKERENIDNGVGGVADADSNSNIMIAIVIILVAAILGFGAILIVKRDRGYEEDRDDKKD